MNDPGRIPGAGSETSRAPRGRRAESQGGFSLVELVIAVMILAVGVLGLAGTTAFVVRQTTLGNLSTERAMAVQSVVERLQASDWDDLSTGSDTFGSFTSRWWIQVDGNESRQMMIETSGPGLGASTDGVPMLRPNVVDTFSYWVLNR